MPSKPKRPVLPTATEGDTSKVYPFSEGEYNKGVAALKNNKAAGRDDILVEQLKHIGPVVVCHDQVRLQVSQGFRCRDS